MCVFVYAYVRTGSYTCIRPYQVLSISVAPDYAPSDSAAPPQLATGGGASLSNVVT